MKDLDEMECDNQHCSTKGGRFVTSYSPNPETCPPTWCFLCTKHADQVEAFKAKAGQ